jgi:photosystem II stability/assembly factor-like uncharacterized protein
LKKFSAIAATVSSLIALAAVGEARGETLACRTLRGPCQFLDSLAVLLPSNGPVLVANFGLVSADAQGRWRFACEAGLGALVGRARMAPDGAIFVAGDEGLVRYQPGCGSRPAGTIPGQAILDVAFDARDPRRVRVLGAAPRAVYESMDGGDHFQRRAPLDGEVLRLVAAPSRPDTLYAAGDGADQRLLLLRSDDGGLGFTALPAAASPPGLVLDLVGVDPVAPDVLFLAVRDADGSDGLWRSGDGGHTWMRALALPALETFGGFTFGATSDTLFVGSRQQFDDPSAPPAHLYVSHDSGRSFAPAFASAGRGPRYRCLGHRDGLLYACGGGTPYGDAFLLGSSADEGRTWTPLVTTEALAGPEPCLAAACAPTSQWLCDTYGLCGDAGRPTAPTDGGSTPTPTDAGVTSAPAGGCGCGMAPSAPPAASIALLLAAIARRRKRSMSTYRLPMGRRNGEGPPAADDGTHRRAAFATRPDRKRALAGARAGRLHAPQPRVRAGRRERTL